MVTLEALMNAGMSEEEARRILEIFNGENTEIDESEEAEPPMADEVAEEAEPKDPASEEPTEESASAEETEPALEEVATEEPALIEESAPAEEPPAEPEPPSANPLAEENAVLRACVVETSLRAGGLAAGVKPERLEALARLADVSGIDPMAADVQEQIDAAVQRALALVPELAMTSPAVTTGSAGLHPREPANPTDPFSRGFRG